MELKLEPVKNRKCSTKFSEEDELAVYRNTW
jgi:hypothetical protein